MASTTRSQLTTTTSPPPHNTTFFRRLHETTPQSSPLLGFLTLVVSGGILLILTGLTFTAIVLGFVLFSPIIVISSPFWLPVAILVFFPIAGFLALCGFGVATLVAFSWFYRYFRGLHPPGLDRFDYARNRIATTAREYGGYLHSKVKDAAPGA